jgi:hypothetical protein
MDPIVFAEIIGAAVITLGLVGGLIKVFIKLSNTDAKHAVILDSHGRRLDKHEAAQERISEHLERTVLVVAKLEERTGG